MPDAIRYVVQAGLRQGRRAAARASEGFFDRSLRWLFGAPEKAAEMWATTKALGRQRQALRAPMERAAQAADEVFARDPVYQRIVNAAERAWAAGEDARARRFERAAQHYVNRMAAIASVDPSTLTGEAANVYNTWFQRFSRVNPNLAQDLAIIRQAEALRAQYAELGRREMMGYPNTAWLWLTGGTPLQTAARVGMVAFGLGTLSRWRSGMGGAFTNAYGQMDIAGIPFV